MNKQIITTNDKYIKHPILLDLKNELELSGHSPNTIKNYVAGVFRFLEFANLDNPHDLTEENFRDYLIYLNSTDLSKKSINAYNAFIRYFFQAVLLKSINFIRVPKYRTTPKPIDFLSHDAILRLLNQTKVDSRIDCIVKLALSCGFRINEIVSLKVCDIDTKSMRIFIRESKRNKSRYVPIDNTSLLALRRYSREYHLKINDYMFTFNHKTKTINNTVRRHFYIYRDLANIPDSVTFHSLRHTFAVNYINAGGDIVDLKYLMGHGSLSTTSLYLHVAYNQKMRVPSFMDSLMEVSHNG